MELALEVTPKSLAREEVEGPARFLLEDTEGGVDLPKGDLGGSREGRIPGGTHLMECKVL